MCCSAKLCACLSCAFMTFCLMAVIATICTYIYDYTPYKDVQPGTCITVRSYFTPHGQSCSCGDECQSTYSCLRIKVNLDTSGPPLPDFNATYNGTYTTKTAQLLDHLNRTIYVTTYATAKNESMLDILDLYSMEGMSCSYKPSCSSDESKMAAEIATYNETYGIPGTVFRCLYSPTSTDRVFLRIGEEHYYIGTIVVLLCFLVGTIVSCVLSLQRCERNKGRTMLVRVPADTQREQTEMQAVGNNETAQATNNDGSEVKDNQINDSQRPPPTAPSQYPPPCAPDPSFPPPTAPYEPPPPYTPSSNPYFNEPPPYKP